MGGLKEATSSLNTMKIGTIFASPPISRVTKPRSSYSGRLLDKGTADDNKPMSRKSIDRDCCRRGAMKTRYQTVERCPWRAIIVLAIVLYCNHPGIYLLPSDPIFVEEELLDKARKGDHPADSQIVL